MNQIPNIEELDQLILAHITIQSGFHAGNNTIDDVNAAGDKIKDWHHQQLQKAREEERERIEAIFEKHVPPHAMDLEDSVWLKRLLNKAFGHENIH